MKTAWRAFLDSKHIGDLELVEIDMPWFNCGFTPTGDYTQYARLFERELALLNADEMEEWEAAYDSIDALGLKLVPTIPGEADIVEPILHIEGSTAWFRH